jgi:kynureninase
LPKATAARLASVVQHEWGEGLIRSWNDAGWIGLARGVADRLGSLVGAPAGTVAVGDSTSVNLFKVLSVAADLQRRDGHRGSVILSERSNFPTDLYIAESVAQHSGLTLRLVDHHELPAALDGDVAVVLWTHVHYRSGRMLPMAAINRAAHAQGTLVVWDLAHSAGAVPVTLCGAADPVDDADFAVGCGYKYLNGGPGAPAFAWAHPRHLDRITREDIRQPLSGWLGHAAPFAFEPTYRPAEGIERFTCGTPSILALTALDCGIQTLLEATPLGGMAAIRRKSETLTQLLMDLVAARCGGWGLQRITPAEAKDRGSQASWAHPHGYEVMQALIERGVIGDFRAGLGRASGDDALGILRLGCAPLYLRHTDIWDAVETLREVLDTGLWRDPRYGRRSAVT